MTSSSTYIHSKRGGRRKKHDTRRNRRTEFLLRLLAVIIGISSISSFGVVIPSWNATFRHNSGPQAGDWTDGMPLAPVRFP